MTFILTKYPLHSSYSSHSLTLSVPHAYHVPSATIPLYNLFLTLECSSFVISTKLFLFIFWMSIQGSSSGRPPLTHAIRPNTSYRPCASPSWHLSRWTFVFCLPANTVRFPQGKTTFYWCPLCQQCVGQRLGACLQYTCGKICESYSMPLGSNSLWDSERGHLKKKHWPRKAHHPLLIKLYIPSALLCTKNKIYTFSILSIHGAYRSVCVRKRQYTHQEVQMGK